jgi:Zn-dependent M28 family amino/carboxypeptidase
MLAAQRPAAPPRPAARDTLSAPERAAVARLRGATIREVTTALAAPAMQGRGTAQAGGERAARYIADRFAALGLKPLGDTGSFLQGIRFLSTRVLPATHLSTPNADLHFGADFVVPSRLASDSLDLTGEVVFVGYGVVAPRLQRDDLAGLDLEGKIAVVLQGRPAGVERAVWDSVAPRAVVLGRLSQHGAVAVLIANSDTPDRPYALVESYLVRRTVTRADAPAPPTNVPLFVLLSDAGAAKLWTGASMTYAAAKAKAESGAFASGTLGGRATIAFRSSRATATSSNVVGLLEGRDTALKAEALAYSSHYDAYGLDEAGRIFPGAADNALGVGMMLAVAEDLAKAPRRPRRSVVFLAVTGEEYGDLGSDYWVQHPTWPLRQIAADINFDGIGTEVYGPVRRVVGWGGEYSNLGPALAEVILATGNIPTADPFPEEGVFYRSDHYNFVRYGIPALMLLGAPDRPDWVARAKRWIGPGGDYHQPGDSVRTDWDWSGPPTLATVGLVLGLRIADADQMPAWLPASPFNSPRGGRSQGR